MDRTDNTKGRRVTYVQGAQLLSKREAFKRGYEDVIKNKEYDYSIEYKLDAISYARGRAFAIWTITSKESKSRWKNGVLSRAGVERLLRAMYAGAVI